MKPASSRSAAALHDAGLADLPVLAAIHAECFAEAWTVTALSEILSMSGTFALTASSVESGTPQPCGFAIARVVVDEAELLSLGVIEPFRSRGIGGRLLDAVIGRAASAGAWRMFLEVAEDNAAARALYLSRGFSPVGRRPDYYRPPGGRPVAALTLRRSLAPAGSWTWPPF